MLKIGLPVITIRALRTPILRLHIARATESKNTSKSRFAYVRFEHFECLIEKLDVLFHFEVPYYCLTGKRQ